MTYEIVSILLEKTIKTRVTCDFQVETDLLTPEFGNLVTRYAYPRGFHNIRFVSSLPRSTCLCPRSILYVRDRIRTSVFRKRTRDRRQTVFIRVYMSTWVRGNLVL